MNLMALEWLIGPPHVARYYGVIMTVIQRKLFDDISSGARLMYEVSLCVSSFTRLLVPMQVDLQ
jgi:hypothetical protein